MISRSTYDAIPTPHPIHLSYCVFIKSTNYYALVTNGPISPVLLLSGQSYLFKICDNIRAVECGIIVIPTFSLLLCPTPQVQDGPRYETAGVKPP